MTPLSVLSQKSFHLTSISSRIETWEHGFVVDNLQNGRQLNLIHIITLGKRNYEAYGKSMQLEAGRILLIPHGTKYITETQCETSGIGVCFGLSDGIQLPQDVYGDWHDRNGEFLRLFQTLHETLQSGIRNELRCQSLLLRILDKMNQEAEINSHLLAVLEPALKYIEAHCCENIPVSEYAQICHLSESYFRRIFLQYTGVSPIEYRDNLRFQLALRQKAQGISTAQIALNTGFCDVSYFRKIFKKRYGVSFSRSEMPEFI